MKITLALTSLFLALVSSSAVAQDDERFFAEIESHSFFEIQSIDPLEQFKKTQAVLNYFKVPADLDPNSVLQPLTGITTEQELRKALWAIDPANQFFRFHTIDSQDVLHGFADRDSKTVEEYAIKLASNPRPLPPNIPRKNLNGVRIALDPGHMGDPHWDDETGKYVEDPNGNRLSEGTLATQVSLLLKKRFESLGATVMLTRDWLGPVTRLPDSRLDLTNYGRMALRENTYLPWFVNLIQAYPVGPNLFSAFQNNGTFQKLFSESQRSQYFILREDLYARVAQIESFKPDITLIIHFDTSDPPGNPNGINTRGYSKTKAYVAGGFSDTELAAPMHRANMVKHLLDRNSWNHSVQLSRSVVHSMSRSLGIGFDPVGGEVMTVDVEPGIFARNLVLTRRLGGHAVSYLECLYYNDPKEFAALRNYKYSIDIAGKSTPYSDRLIQVTDGIYTGVLNYYGI